MSELTRASDDALLERADATESRRIDLRLMRWGDVAQTADSGPEAFARGAFAGVDPERVTLEAQRHGGPLVGVGESLRETESEAVMTFRVAATPAGDELLTLARERVLTSASVVFRPIKSRTRPDGVIERQGVDLLRVALLERGAYASASVTAVREAAPMEVPEVSEAVVNIEPVVDRLEGIESRMAQLETLATVPAAAARPDVYRYENLGAFADAVYRGEIEADALARTVADQITSQNAGMIPPAWLSDVKRTVDLGRRAITAFGGARPLPSTGMEIDWPFLTSSNTVIGQQSTQKTEITSARIDIDKGSATVVTYAGGSDISYQLLQRSSPSYRDAYDRIMLAEWGKITDAAFVAALEAASGTTTMAARGVLGADIALATSAASDDIIDTTPDHGLSIGDAVVFTSLTGGTGLTAGKVYWVVSTSFGAKTFRVTDKPGGAAIGFSADITAGNVAKVTDTGQRFREALFQASVAIEDATGQPAGIILASTDMFLALSGLAGMVPPQPSGAPAYPTGVAQASSLTMAASGLEIIRCPGVSAGKVVLSNRMAAAWHEDGPRFVTSEDVMKLGQNVAVYSFAAPAIFVPAGIVELTLI